MKSLIKRSTILGVMVTALILLSSVAAFADTSTWAAATVENSSIGVSKQIAEIKSLTYEADNNLQMSVVNDKVTITGDSAYLSNESVVAVSGSVKTEDALESVTYKTKESGAKAGEVTFDSKKIDARYATSYFNIKITTGDVVSVIKVKAEIGYGDLYVYAFQMNTKHGEGDVSEFNPSFRVVSYCGNVLAGDEDENGNRELIPVKNFGTVYGIGTEFQTSELVKDSTNDKVLSYDSTRYGLVDVKNATIWDNYYALTFKNLSYNPELLDRNYTLRPYAILEDNSILYSDDVQTTSIYDVAQVLYERNAMSTTKAREFLVDHILNVVKVKNSYTDIAKTMLTVLNVTDKTSINYKFVNTLYKDLFYWVQLTHDYEVEHYYDRGPFVPKTFTEGVDTNVELLQKLNNASGTNYDTMRDWIKFETPKYGVEGMYVPAGVYKDNVLVEEWNDLVKNGDIVVDDETLKSVSDNVEGDLYIPETITTVEAAKGEKLDSVTVPTTVTQISDNAFSAVPTVTYNGEAEGAPWSAQVAIVNGTELHTHVYDSGVITTPATCTTEGVKTYTCTVDGCSDSYTESIAIDPTNHNWDAGEVTTPATCTTKGVKTYTCADCDVTKTEEININPDNHVCTSTITKAATCDKPGTKIYECTECDYSKTETINPLVSPYYVETEDVGEYGFKADKLAVNYSSDDGNISNYSGEEANRFTSNNKGVDNSTAKTIFKITAVEDNVPLKIKYRISTEEDHDYFLMYYDGNLVENGSGVRVEQEYDVAMSKGTHEIVCIYTKDSEGGSYSDTLGYNDSAYVIFNFYTHCTFGSGTVINEGNCQEHKLTEYTCKRCNNKKVFEGPLGEHSFNDSICSVCGVDENSIYVAYNSTEKRLAFSNKESDLSNCDVQYGNIRGINFTSGADRPWSSVAKEIKDVDILSEIKPTNIAYWFYNVGYNEMTSLDLTNLNTSNVSNMNYAFYSCGYSKLENVVLGYKFDTNSLISANSMFYNCGYSKKTIYDMGSFAPDVCFKDKSSGYTNIFKNMNSADVLYFKAKGTVNWVYNLRGSSTTSGYLPSWYTDSNLKVACDGKIEHSYIDIITTQPTCTSYGYKNRECEDCGYSETNVRIPKVDHKKGDPEVRALPNCAQKGLIVYVCQSCGKTFNEETSQTNEHIYNSDDICINCHLSKDVIEAPDAVYVGYNKTSKTLVFSNNDEDPKYTACSEKYGNLYNSTSPNRMWSRHVGSFNKDITTVDFANPIKPKYTNSWFYDMQSITTINNIENLYTFNTISMNAMFNNCKISSLDLSNLDTSRVRYMDTMFRYASNLTELDLSNFNTKLVTSMSGMFAECSSLENINVSSFDTLNVTDFGQFFTNCSSLKSLDMSSFDTPKITDTSYMFSGCSNLKNLDITKFDLSNVTNSNMMFSNCSSLTNIIYGSKFTNDSLTSSTNMFNNCPANKPEWYTE